MPQHSSKLRAQKTNARIGKSDGKTKKGQKSIAAKSTTLRKKKELERKFTAGINRKNEVALAAKVQATSGRLAALANEQTAKKGSKK